MKTLCTLIFICAALSASLSASPIQEQTTNLFDWKPSTLNVNLEQDFRIQGQGLSYSVPHQQPQFSIESYKPMEHGHHRPPPDCNEVPEPATLALTGMALVFGAVRLRRR